ncbi:MAG: DNA polymerase I [Kiritimatiellaceae bacterium]|nr:DNA polymerase I [Kiritimatiellaceae bacterium]
MPNKLFLIDGMALIYRAYFAFIRTPRITSAGEDVSAIFGFLNTLFDIQRKYEPTHLAVALDRSEPTFRHDIFPEYKANRDETPEAIRYAIPIIKQALELMRIPVLELAGYEADDIIGTLARQAQKQQFETFMVTPDKDYAQLVDTTTYMLKPSRGGGDPELLDVQAICEQWNIKEIHQVIDILGLAGDASDNIPGVPGIGPKTAQKLIATYGSVESILENTDQLKGKQKENLENFKEQALLSKKLVTIHCEVPIDVTPSELIPGETQHEALKELLTKLEFRTMLKRFYADEVATEPPPTFSSDDLFSQQPQQPQPSPSSIYETITDRTVTYQQVTTAKERKDLASLLSQESEICIDLETTSLNVKEAEIVGIALSIKANQGWFVSLPSSPDALDSLEPFLPLFENRSITKIGQNLKYDLSVLRWNGINLKGPLIDTMIAHYLIDPDQRHNLEAMAESILQYSPIPLNKLIGEKKSEQISVRDVPLDQLTTYAVEDADITLQLWQALKPLLIEKELEKVFYEIEMPLLPVLAEMEFRGITVDANILKDQSIGIDERIITLEKSIHTQAGMPFNLNSPKQLGEVLFDLLHIIEKPKKTKTGQYQTNEEVLSELAPEHPIVKEILHYRQLSKLKNTYLDALPLEIFPKTGRIHTTFSQAVTTTGRLSSQNPNIQNIPIRTEEGRQIRRAFIPKQGSKLLACDYSQIELRIMAELSDDTGLKEAFCSGADIHTATAANVFKVDAGEVTREMRSKAKMVNFGIIYGISAFGLSQRLGIPRGEAATIIKQYQAAYPGVQDYLDRTIAFAQQHEYVETVTGRRRYIRDINAKNKMVRSGAERNAINAPIQGTAADMIKIAMTRIEEVLQTQQAKTAMLLQVHDELVFDLDPDEEEQLVPQIEAIMQQAIPMQIPILIESGIGDNWLEAH